jgi:hypothetical protein
MEHSLNLGVTHILSCITPMHTGKIDGTSNDNDNDKSLAGDTSDDCGDVIAGALCKLIGLIKQVHPIDCNSNIY